MTTANKITVLRILLVPFFVLQVVYYVNEGEELYRLLAILSFGIASISDGIDGYIARRYNQRSELGAVLDPLADKLLLVAGIVLLSLDNRPHLHSIPVWLTVTILSRDSLLLIGLVVIHLMIGKVAVKPHMIGKVATVLQMVVVLWVLLKWMDSWIIPLSLAAATCTGVSGLLYIYVGMGQLSASPSSAPSPKQDQT